jgi:uncharacterized protein YndB with AHSA1/START domain
MIIDLASQIGAIDREVSRQTTDGGEMVSVLLTRTYDAAIDDVWDALTDPDRVKRWFLPLSGDLRAGGTFQLEGNAGGDILLCEPPRRLRLTFGGPTSLVELRLAEQAPTRTAFELEHTVPIEMARSGAGALFVGPGWDGALLGLGLFLEGQVADDPVAAANSQQGQEFSRHSVQAWESVVRSSGTASDEEIAAAVEMSMAQFAPDA